MNIVKVSGTAFYLDAPAAVALEQAFAAGCPKTKITETYRSYADQVKLFVERYRVQLFGSGAYGDVRWWKGKRYVRVSGLGMAAIPGTSVHGSGNAIDCDDPMRTWLREHPQYGWKFTIASEPWHCEYSPSRHTATPVSNTHTTTSPITNATISSKKEDDDMAAFTLHARSKTTNGTSDGEWTLGHADFGSDLAPFDTPTTPAMRRVIETRADGVVVEYRGFLVTTSPTVAVSWGRTYKDGAGSSDSSPDRAGYIVTQKQLSLVAQASHR